MIMKIATKTAIETIKVTHCFPNYPGIMVIERVRTPEPVFIGKKNEK